MQKPWLNCVARRCQFHQWMEELDPEKRYDLVLDFVRAHAGGTVNATKPPVGDGNCGGKSG